MSYKSPITIYYRNIQTQIEEAAVRVCCDAGIVIEKEELLRALKYEREQYEQGYRDAKDEIVHCEKCKEYDTLDNGLRYCKFFSKILEDAYYIPRPNGYCDRGKRKTDEDEPL